MNPVTRLAKLSGFVRPWCTKYGVLLGLRCAAAIRRARWAATPGTLVRVPIPWAGGPVMVRAGSSDALVLSQLGVRGELDIALPFRPQRVVDGGANIGLASIVFSNQWPDVAVIAVELDAANAALARINLAPYAKVVLLHAGLWDRDEMLGIDNPGDDAWAFRASADRTGGTGGVPGVRIGDLLDNAGWATVDIVKLDIEGAEVEVLRDAPAWLPRTRCVLVELHDRFRPGCLEALDAVLNDGEWERSMSGEYVIAWRKEWPADAQP